MKSRKGCVAAFGFMAVIAAVGSGFSAFWQASTAERRFEVTYLTRIPGLPAEAKISRIWIPLPQSGPHQTISDLKIESPFPYTTHRDSEYGNEYVYLEVPAAKVAAPADVRVHFQATRQEHRVALGAQPIAAKTGVDAGEQQRFLQPDQRGRLGGIIGEPAAKETKAQQYPMRKARAS